MFDLSRLERKQRIFKFMSPEGKEIEISCHYPSPHEIAASLAETGADLERAVELSKGSSKEGNLEALDLTARLGGSMEELACYCIDWCSELQIKKVKDKNRLRRISPENEEALAPVLGIIGGELYKGSEVSEEEGEG